jgi:hypothetical protein
VGSEAKQTFDLVQLLRQSIPRGRQTVGGTLRLDYFWCISPLTRLTDVPQLDYYERQQIAAKFWLGRGHRLAHEKSARVAFRG